MRGPAWLLLAFGLVWGASVIADSAQFSASVTELSEPAYMGTALTLQTSLGFALTLVTIWGLPLLAQHVGWRYAFLVLAPGPIPRLLGHGRAAPTPRSACVSPPAVDESADGRSPVVPSRLARGASPSRSPGQSARPSHA